MSNAYKFSLFAQNVQKSHMKSDCNVDIRFFNLRASNLGRHERYGYVSEKQYGHEVTDMRRVSDGRHLQLEITPYKFMLDT